MEKIRCARHSGSVAGAAGGVLSTVNQVGGSIGVAALGTLFFAHVADALGPAGAGPRGGFTDAFAAVLPWQVGLYVVAAALMTLLPAGTAPAEAVDAARIDRTE